MEESSTIEGCGRNLRAYVQERLWGGCWTSALTLQFSQIRSRSQHSPVEWGAMWVRAPPTTVFFLLITSGLSGMGFGFSILFVEAEDMSWSTFAVLFLSSDLNLGKSGCPAKKSQEGSQMDDGCLASTRSNFLPFALRLSRQGGTIDRQQCVRDDLQQQPSRRRGDEETKELVQTNRSLQDLIDTGRCLWSAFSQSSTLRQ